MSRVSSYGLVYSYYIKPIRMTLDYCILEIGTIISDFSCGTLPHQEILNAFLRERAKPHQNELIGTTTVVIDRNSNNKIAGYMTVLADSIRVVKKHKRRFFKSVDLHNRYSSYPAIQIGRLAVDKDYQRQGVGPYLFKLSIAYALTSNQELGIGVRFIVVHSKDESRSWYLDKLNFKSFDKAHPNILIYDILGWKDTYQQTTNNRN